MERPKLLTRSSSPKKCENLNLRAQRAPNYTKVPSCVEFMGRMAGWTRPFGAHLGASRAPKGVLPPRIRPEKADTRPKKIAITGRNCCFGARRAGDFHFSCVFMPQQKQGGRIRPGSRRTCRGKAPPSCCARPFGRLKSPLGTSLFRCASQTRTFPRCA